ncbi:MAG: tetratricopeptide repeat protein [Myxococcota bacterium]
MVSRPASTRRAIETELDTLRHHHAAHELLDYRARAEAVHAAADRLGDGRLMVRALLVLAGAPEEDDGHADGLEEAREAYELAVRVEDQALAGQAAAVVASFEEPESDRYSHWVRTAEAHIEMAGGDHEAEIDLARAQTFAAIALEDWDLALLHWEPGVTLFEEFLGHEHPATGNAYELLASIYQFLNRTESAHSAIRRALQIYDTQLPEGSVTAAGARVELGRVLFELGDHARAVHQIELALSRLDAGDEHDHTGSAPDEHALAYGHWTMGLVLESLGQYRSALEHYGIVRDEFPPHDGYNMLLLFRGIGDAHLALGEREEAIVALERSLTFVDPTAAEWEERISTRRLLEAVRECGDGSPCPPSP